MLVSHPTNVQSKVLPPAHRVHASQSIACLPDDLLENIFRQLSIVELPKLSSVCQKWNLKLENPQFWLCEIPILENMSKRFAAICRLRSEYKLFSAYPTTSHFSFREEREA
jgi:hypothetical protein